MGKTRKGLEYLLGALLIGSVAVSGCADSKEKNISNITNTNVKTTNYVCYDCNGGPLAKEKWEAIALYEKAWKCKDKNETRKILSEIAEKYSFIPQGSSAEYDIIGLIENPSKKVEEYRTYLKKNPKSNFRNDCRYRIAETLRQQGRIGEAISEYGKIEENNYIKNDAGLILGEIYIKSGEFGKVLDEYRKIIEKYDRNKEDEMEDSFYASMAYSGIARAYEKQGKIGEAIKMHEEIIGKSDFGGFFEMAADVSQKRLKELKKKN